MYYIYSLNLNLIIKMTKFRTIITIIIHFRMEKEHARLAEMQRQMEIKRHQELEREEQLRRLSEEREKARLESEKKRLLEMEKRRLEVAITERRQEQESLSEVIVYHIIILIL